ncbi:hypothetical protein BN1723_008816 [Verticillium longisporum]|uniref:Thiolase N-terminal domain-containing protein n=1 Tax=Verticillium longisporum TaxID=100787 RepID=A0A0G4KJ36_VERLO|nr:hypothetical protein BN1723_008816 [Verticillium longisporum]
MGAIERISQLSGQIVGASGKEKLLQKNPDDVVVTAALRTPFTKGGKVRQQAAADRQQQGRVPNANAGSYGSNYPYKATEKDKAEAKSQAQEEFDALLERERQVDEGKSGWGRRLSTMGAIERISQLSGQIVGASGKEKLLQKNPDDVVVTAALRTPFTKGGKGGFKDTQAADLMAGALKALLERSKIDPALVEDIAVGTLSPMIPAHLTAFT